MAFCTNCGKELAEGAKFCTNCGAALAPAASMEANDATAQAGAGFAPNNGAAQADVDAGASMAANNGTAQAAQNYAGAGSAPNSGTTSRGRVQKYEGEIHKCPNCGAPTGAFDAVCPECGCEVRGRAASSAVSQLAEKLSAIENNNSQKRGLSGTLLGVTGQKADARVRLIKSFAVPNTIEDLTEFFVLATSSLDEGHLTGTKTSHIGGAAIMRDKSIAEAWLAKMEQTYTKAKLTFGTRPEFQAIEDMYQNKLAKIKKAKNKYIAMCILPFVFIIIALLGTFVPLKLLGLI